MTCLWRYNKIVLFLISLLLISCTSLTVKPQKVSYRVVARQVREVRLSKIKHWSIAGAFAISQGGRSRIANYTWDEIDQQNYSFRISSALDLYNFILIGQPGQVTLYQGAKKHISAASPERLMQKVLGWALPLQNLYYWIRAVPAPGSHVAHYDQFGHLTNLIQNGWQIQYSSFIPVRNVDLPRLITVSRPGLSIKIAVKQWRLSRPHLAKVST